MASIEIDPESDVVTGSAGDNWYDFIQSWHDWIKNTSTKWDITDFTDDEAGSSGDMGFITTPTTGNLDFEVRLYARSGSSGVDVTASLDPGGNISSVASGTTKPTESEWPSTASQDPHNVFNQISQRDSGSLISATDESLTMITRDPSGSEPSITPDLVHFGDIYTPVFANDSDDGLDGLGYLAGYDSGQIRYDTTTGTNTDAILFNYGGGKSQHNALFQTASGEFGVLGSLQGSTAMQNGGVSKGPDSPQPVGLQYAQDGNTPDKMAGFLKYSYVWDEGEEPLEKLELRGNTGFIFVHETAGNQDAVILFPWEKSKNPLK